MTAYYNEIDPFAAAWLQNLIWAGVIAPGDVDTRDIRDVKPDDLRGYTQCHFFAGIGVWSHALRGAGWPDDRPVWTGSCPCQPFSAAGKGLGVADERHLWPHWFWLIDQCRPATVFGEQVASKDGRVWFDTVSADMEALGFAIGAADLCAAGVGAPHIRQRLFFGAYDLDADGEHGFDARSGVVGMADAKTDGWREECSDNGRGVARNSAEGIPTGHGSGSGTRRVADADGGERHRIAEHEGDDDHGAQTGRVEGYGVSTGSVGTRRVADADSTGPLPRTLPGVYRGEKGAGSRDGKPERSRDTRRMADPRTSPTDGFWRDADWLGCTDGKWRPVEPGTFPLAHGASARVGRLRGYGNAIVAPAAQAFIEAFMGW